MVSFSTLIQNWYRQNRRDLPWRDTSDPYKIWLSEIILQQTRVDQGLSYYLKFVDHYPTVHHLANASEDEVLNDWQGLGYYSRARNLHAAAKFVSQQLGGVFPKSYEDILNLKGIGEYTASAISSIAFGLPYAVVDGNVYRVLSRVLDLADPIDSNEGKKKFKRVAEELLDQKNPSDHNQSLMELGALVCSPKNPLCDHCPLNNQCLALANGSISERPVKSKKVKVRDRYFHYLILEKDNQIMIRKRGAGDIWQGLYDFPLIEKESQQEPTPDEFKQFGIGEIEQTAVFRHILTHQRILANFWMARVEHFPNVKNTITISKDQLHEYPMPQLLIRYVSSVNHFTID